MKFSARSITSLTGIRSPLSKVAAAVTLLLAGYYVGALIADPQRRVIQAAAALLLFYLASRFSMYQSLAFFLVVFPYPTVTSVGSTNTMILLTIFIIWGTRVAAGELKIEYRSLLGPLLPFVLLAYLVSTYSIHNRAQFLGGMGVITDVLAAMILYLLVTNFVRDETTLRRTLFFLGISAILIHTVTVYEVMFPHHDFLPGWILSDIPKQDVIEKIRTGGPFRDYELMSEFSAVSMPIVVFMFLRSSGPVRGFWALITGMTVFSLFTTVTRGGFVSLTIGVIYLFWLIRNEIGKVRAVVTLLAVSACMAAVGFVLPHLIGKISLFDRLEKTTFENGIPDSRVGAWTESWDRLKEHVFIGHGPWYDLGSGLLTYHWPHNGYLYLWVTIGLFGLIAYLVLFLSCLFATGRFRGPFVSGPFSPGFLTALHISWFIFIVDQLKIDFERNRIYFLFSWFLIALTAAAYAIARERAAPGVIFEKPEFPLPAIGGSMRGAPVSPNEIAGVRKIFDR